MIFKFVEEIFGKIVPWRFGDPVQHLSLEPLLKIIFQRYLGGGSTRASAIPLLWMLVYCLSFMGWICLNVLTLHVNCFVQD